MEPCERFVVGDEGVVVSVKVVEAPLPVQLRKEEGGRRKEE